MKKIIVILAVVLGLSSAADAQFIRVRIGFPVGYSVRPARAPHTGAIWIGPEWRWQRGRYVAVPGYWARPHRHHAVWVPGHWAHSRRGYRWMPGYWR
jgi:hypothetical protein